MPANVFEDFVAGDVTTYGKRTVGEDDMVAFAQEFDAQPMHVDPQAARETFAGQLIGSGWYTCSIAMRMFYDNVLAGSSSMGSPGVDQGLWVRPVLPGDTLQLRQTIAGTRTSRSRPEMGLVNFVFDVFNQKDETVYRQDCWVMFGRREAWQNRNAENLNGEPAPASQGTQESPAADAAQQPGGAPDTPARVWFDDLEIGDTASIGSHHFSAEEIIRFARAFDPQPFHTDPDAARETHFGGLCASGWHTASVWMKLTVAHRRAEARRAREAGAEVGRLGPSPGFTNLRWRRPVYAGDVLTYHSRVADKRISSSRPGWGIVSTVNSATNARGEPVFSFDGAVFWERRGAD
ncbi:acyl dehydratase [Pseudochelatococcus lubricantis]|uniref:Acyl dehydratase n=1 Tax=Pseudochelatococcus lubricantis TaxID=1538102 RepID=A0ABX0UZW6_9HYPH|nr:MaoC family dehydratase [Pseudochelatococcus lubricantis]NIJ58504.1 acyl dehydratase [Pseudochelatococcus lubricantis]